MKNIQLYESFMDSPKTPGGKEIICLMSEGGWMGVGSIIPGEEAYIKKLLSGGWDSVEMQTLHVPDAEGIVVLRGGTNTFEFLESGSVLNLQEGEDFVFPLLLPGKFFCYTAAGHTTDAVLLPTPELARL